MVPLPVVHRSRLAVDTSPLVRELASVEEEFGRLLTVVLDRSRARFFEVTAYESQEVSGLHSESTRGKRFHSDNDGTSGWGEHTYNNRIRQEKQRHYEAIARELFAMDRRHPAHGIVLAGGDAGAVEPFLHSYLAERLIGTVRLNPKDATPATVHAATLAVREGFERASERALVHEMLEGVGSGWGVNGLGPDAQSPGAGTGPLPSRQLRREQAGVPLRGFGPAGAHRVGMPGRGRADPGARHSWTTLSRKRCGRESM